MFLDVTVTGISDEHWALIQNNLDAIERLTRSRIIRGKEDSGQQEPAHHQSPRTAPDPIP